MANGSDKSERSAGFAPATGYVTAVWVLNCAAEERENAARKLREWTEAEHNQGLSAVIPQIDREAKELRAAAQMLESHTAKLTDGSEPFGPAPG